ncbi:2-amino-4-hydroxy-6-hydroxymethyldihydropteridine diphosphokinase [Proteiniclasticum sp. QWL-01]|uniref:2-amino-4-hydroxy-6- hydroxymethyldihydropteridine diphosphokinase n=1 Tax=Proteiniclasticum sp. QWL-01 TaxID=3036945 RepID=UPI0024103C65|nr:2-amino-4-hydroxy-6-hydroxymethyldihydropteridine diphosphokinase [Proteiniclasticum sp. QWL-01]WFF72478.1 2-amino-4-hydroxy-6-hydroxymethyldihydropteridine diphosphokinase [Proteiniclasticum sp. QWL-01]
MTRIYLGLGSNLGERRENIERALERLSEQVRLTKRSSFYETEPVGYDDQPWFYNIVVEGETDLEPAELLRFTQSIEQGMKRVKTIRNGPRNIDVDILIYDEIRVKTDTLEIPHPRMRQRAFVMVPLSEIEPDLVIYGTPLRDILQQLQGEAIRKVTD